MSPHVRETRSFASEVKFIVDEATGARIAAWARVHMQADPHGTGEFGDEYHTTSLYFDTDAGDVFHRRGSYGRSKYRIRRYGSASSVFLERKLRRPGILVKRRTCVGLDTLERLAGAEPDREWPGEWFHRRLLLRRIQPTCLLSYARIARSAGGSSEPARLTLDRDVRVLPAKHSRAGVWMPDDERGAGARVLEDRMILELKFRHHLPFLFKRLVESFGLGPERASKYRLGIAALAGSGTLPAASTLVVPATLPHV